MTGRPHRPPIGHDGPVTPGGERTEHVIVTTLREQLATAEADRDRYRHALTEIAGHTRPSFGAPLAAIARAALADVTPSFADGPEPDVQLAVHDHQGPDCASGSHRGCIGQAWCAMELQRVACTCTCHDRAEVA